VSDRLEQLDYYTLLGVSADASVDDIKRAFRAFATRYHPDRFAEATEDKRERASLIYRRGSEAVQVLTVESSRRAYDAILKQGKVRLTNEERERAEAAEKAAPVEHNPIRSPQARALFERAAEAARKADWRESWKLLKSALEHEPDNELIQTRIKQVTDRVRASRV
jgi:DnaJ-class molecular chaperone